MKNPKRRSSIEITPIGIVVSLDIYNALPQNTAIFILFTSFTQHMSSDVTTYFYYQFKFVSTE